MRKHNEVTVIQNAQVVLENGILWDGAIGSVEVGKMRIWYL